MTRVILFDKKSVHIDGYKSIISFDEENVRLQCSKCILEVYGSKLYIASFTGIEMEIKGVIEGVRWLNS